MKVSENEYFKLKRSPTEQELETICDSAEDAARNIIFKKFDPKQITDLDIAIESYGDKPLTLTVDISIYPRNSNEELDKLVDIACDEALRAAEMKAKELKIA
ncbi:DUF3194 domain-containing protein [[Eubacterium] cellulosolvens]